jgi:hypothetical protein
VRPISWTRCVLLERGMGISRRTEQKTLRTTVPRKKPRSSVQDWSCQECWRNFPLGALPQRDLPRPLTTAAGHAVASINWLRMVASARSATSCEAQFGTRSTPSPADA